MPFTNNTSGPPPFSYPAHDPGMPVVPVQEILDANADQIGRLKLAYGVDIGSFERDIMTLVRSYAEYVNILPATPGNHFTEPGGLFRLGLEVGHYALQATDSRLFACGVTSDMREHLVPRWRLATFIAALCGELHRTLGQVVVRDEDGQVWPAYLHGMTVWLSGRSRMRFFAEWLDQPQEIRALGLFALPRIVPDSTLQHLAADNNVVVPHMMAAVCGMATYRDHNVLDELVRRATASVINRDLESNARRYGGQPTGSHLQRYLVDALRWLVANSQMWQANVRQSRLWFGCDGLFLLWPDALADMAALLAAEQLPGIPRMPATLLEILLEAGVLLPNDQGGGVWPIWLPGGDVAIEAVRLIHPTVALAALQPPPVSLADQLHWPAGQRPPPPRAGNTAAPAFGLRPAANVQGSVNSSVGKIVAAFDGKANATVAKFENGLFIAHEELRKRNLGPTQVVDMLGRAGMLVPGKGPREVHELIVEGRMIQGMVIAAEWIEGWDEAPPSEAAAP